MASGPGWLHLPKLNPRAAGECDRRVAEICESRQGLHGGSALREARRPEPQSGERVLDVAFEPTCKVSATKRCTIASLERLGI
jgi:hypothetical protein